MPDSGRDIIVVMRELTEAFQGASEAMRELLKRIEIDRRFRRITVSVLTGLVLIVGAITLSLARDVAQEKHQTCLNANEFRRDLYDGVDAVLDSITSDASPEVQATVADAKEAIRKKVPLRAC